MSILARAFLSLAVLVGLVSMVNGPDSAADTAGKAGSTIGITTGALVGMADDLTKGFKAAKRASENANGQDPAFNRDRDNRPRGGNRNGNRNG